MTVTVTLIAPAGTQSYEARSGNQYIISTVNGVSTMTVAISDVVDALNAGFVLTNLPSSLQTLFGAGGAGFSEAGILTRYQSIAGVGNGNDTSEDTLFTYNLPANSLDLAGRTLLITASGSFANNAHSKTAKVYFGASLIATTGAQTAAGVGWQIQLQVQKVAANSQLGFYTPIIGATHGGISAPVAGTETDTAAIPIKVTGQTGTAAAADVVLNSILIEALN